MAASYGFKHLMAYAALPEEKLAAKTQFAGAPAFLLPLAWLVGGTSALPLARKSSFHLLREKRRDVAACPPHRHPNAKRPDGPGRRSPGRLDHTFGLQMTLLSKPPPWRSQTDWHPMQRK